MERSYLNSWYQFFSYQIGEDHISREFLFSEIAQNFKFQSTFMTMGIIIWNLWIFVTLHKKENGGKMGNVCLETLLSIFVMICIFVDLVPTICVRSQWGYCIPNKIVVCYEAGGSRKGTWIIGVKSLNLKNLTSIKKHNRKIFAVVKCNLTFPKQDKKVNKKNVTVRLSYLIQLNIRSI